MVSSTALTLIVIPAVYALWRGREVPGSAPAQLPGRRSGFTPS